MAQQPAVARESGHILFQGNTLYIGADTRLYHQFALGRWFTVLPKPVVFVTDEFGDLQPLSEAAATAAREYLYGQLNLGPAECAYMAALDRVRDAEHAVSKAQAALGHARTYLLATVEA